LCGKKINKEEEIINIDINNIVFLLVVFGKIKKLFTKAQETIDWLNKVINESILGASIVRLLNSQQQEYPPIIQFTPSLVHVTAEIDPKI
jgi:ABC-type multidrug transport system fused ATPase/permease subunit